MCTSPHRSGDREETLATRAERALPDGRGSDGGSGNQGRAAITWILHHSLCYATTTTSWSRIAWMERVAHPWLTVTGAAPVETRSLALRPATPAGNLILT